MAFFPEACDYLADNKKDIVAMAEPLNGSIMSSYKEIAKANKIWLSLGGLHEAVSLNFFLFLYKKNIIIVFY